MLLSRCDHQCLSRRVVFFLVALIVMAAGEESQTLFAEEGVDWQAQVVAGHERIRRQRANSIVWLRQARPGWTPPFTEITKIWHLDGSFKFHTFEVPELTTTADVVDDVKLMKDPFSVRIVTPQFEFGLRRLYKEVDGVRVLDRLRRTTLSIDGEKLEMWQRRMSWTMSEHAWSSTTMCHLESSGLFAQPPRNTNAFGWTVDKFTVGPVAFEKLSSGLVRMSFVTHSEMTDVRKKQIVSDVVEATANLNPAHNYRVVESDYIVTGSQKVPGKEAAPSWHRIRIVNEYRAGFGRDMFPTHVVTQNWSSKERDKLYGEPIHSDEYFIDKVEFGQVRKSDFRPEPYGIRPEILEIDPLPPPTSWWVYGIYGSVITCVLIGLVWWFKRRRERLV